MPKAKNITRARQQTAPVWAGDGIDYLNVLPGGGILEIDNFPPDADGRINVRAGTLLGRTYAERDAATGWGLADPATDDQFYLLLFDVYDANLNNNHSSDEIEFYRHNRLIYENMLPGWDTATSSYKAKIRELYECILGVD